VIVVHYFHSFSLFFLDVMRKNLDSIIKKNGRVFFLRDHMQVAPKF